MKFSLIICTYQRPAALINLMESVQEQLFSKVKWFFIVNFLPLPAEMKLAIGKKWHREDWERSRDSDSDMFRCMHLTMLMQKKD